MAYTPAPAPTSGPAPAIPAPASTPDPAPAPVAPAVEESALSGLGELADPDAGTGEGPSVVTSEMLDLEAAHSRGES